MYIEGGQDPMRIQEVIEKYSLRIPASKIFIKLIFLCNDIQTNGYVFYPLKTFLQTINTVERQFIVSLGTNDNDSKNDSKNDSNNSNNDNNDNNHGSNNNSSDNSGNSGNGGNSGNSGNSEESCVAEVYDYILEEVNAIIDSEAQYVIFAEIPKFEKENGYGFVEEIHSIPYFESYWKGNVPVIYKGRTITHINVNGCRVNALFMRKTESDIDIRACSKAFSLLFSKMRNFIMCDSSRYKRLRDTVAYLCNGIMKAIDNRLKQPDLSAEEIKCARGFFYDIQSIFSEINVYGNVQ
eukprot:Pgem_evm2s4161